MQQGRVIDFDSSLALTAARLSLADKLPLAGSIMLATIRAYGAVLWTQDADFKGKKDVQYLRK